MKTAQAVFFDNADAEWEIERPHGAPLFHSWLLREKFQRSISAIRDELAGCSALVVCAGSGMDTESLARAGAHVIAADISLGAAQRARERAARHGLDMTVIVADVEQLPFRDQSIDVVYVHDGLHHIERPLEGLAEMARVARRAVCVSEPARAAVTALAVRLGLALDKEEAGNRVERLGVDEMRATLGASGFQVVVAERYAMYYRHRPGRGVKLLSHPLLRDVAQGSFHLANAVAARWGNKVSLQAVRVSP